LEKGFQTAEAVNIPILIEKGISKYPTQRNEEAAPVVVDVVGQAFGGNDVTLFAGTDQEK
jgi:hypothetical protein